MLLDANVFWGAEWYLQGAAGRLLLGEAMDRRLHVVVPEVVLLEAEANHQGEVGAARSRLAAVRRDLRQLRLGHLVPEAETRPHSLTYRAELEQILRDNGAEILPIPDVPHRQFVDKAIARGLPLIEQKGGYRDALIWESVLELFAASSNPIVLISNDKGFSETKDKAELARDLVHELDEMGQAARVTLYFSLGDYTSQLPKARGLAADWRKLLKDAEFERALTDYLIEQAHSDADAVIGSSNLSSQGYVRNARFTAFENTRDLDVEEVWVSSDGSTILNVIPTLDYAQEFEIARPSGAPEPFLIPAESRGALELSFEVIQQDPNDPARLAGHLTGWRELASTVLLRGG